MVAMATYSSHRLIVGKVEIGLNIFIPQYVHEQYKDMQKH